MNFLSLSLASRSIVSCALSVSVADRIATTLRLLALLGAGGPARRPSRPATASRRARSRASGRRRRTRRTPSATSSSIFALRIVGARAPCPRRRARRRAGRPPGAGSPRRTAPRHAGPSDGRIVAPGGARRRRTRRAASRADSERERRRGEACARSVREIARNGASNVRATRSARNTIRPIDGSQNTDHLQGKRANRSRKVGHLTTIVLQSGTKWGTLLSRSRSGVAGLLPLRHLGSTDHPYGHAPWPFTAPSNTRSTRRTG